MAVRVRLLKPYTHIYKTRPWPIGQVLQLTTQLASELLADKIAEIYEGEYPPKEKMKTDYFKPKK